MVAVWNALDRLHDLPGKNPARKLIPHALESNRRRVDHDDLPGWYARVQELPPVRRDLQLFTLFTGLRCKSARMVRFDDVDRERGLSPEATATGQ